MQVVWLHVLKQCFKCTEAFLNHMTKIFPIVHLFAVKKKCVARLLIL